jgi:chaperonin cofactor prefoldin
MILNSRVEELEEQLEKSEKGIKTMEESYENILKVIGEKERMIEDLLGENASLKL